MPDPEAGDPVGNQPPPSHLAAIAIGSNLSSLQGGSPEDNLHQAVARLAALGDVLTVSGFYKTAPVGFLDQPDFFNAALLLDTALSPSDLMRGLFAVERAMGRNRRDAPPKGPRIIDLDLLLYDRVVLSLPELTLPHPAMTERAFVLRPLAEIAPDLVHPVSGLSVAEHLARLS